MRRRAVRQQRCHRALTRRIELERARHEQFLAARQIADQLGVEFGEAARMAQRVEGHARGQRAVADDGHGLARLGKPARPPVMRKVFITLRRPVRILWT